MRLDEDEDIGCCRLVWSLLEVGEDAETFGEFGHGGWVLVVGIGWRESIAVESCVNDVSLSKEW